MRDLIDSDVLRHAVDTTMKRYPYFCVELQKKDGQYIFTENHRPVVITNSVHGVELNSEDSNYHMIAFCFQDNWIILDVFHGMTDGTGAYEVLRTLLYYYCSERYHVKLNDEGIRLAGDAVSEEERSCRRCRTGHAPGSSFRLYASWRSAPGTYPGSASWRV